MRVIVAEDEKWVRATIIRTIPFEKLGLTLVHEASNGLEAIELCREYQPDILLTDIMMPGLSGLELIEELRKSLPDIKIIIISGYSDFEYAKAALKFDVCDYLLKPIDEVEISRVLSKLKNDILNSKKKIDEINFYKKSYKKALPIIHEKFLNSIVSQNQFTVSVIKTQLASFDIVFDMPFFKVIVFSPSEPFLLSEEAKSAYFKSLLGKIMRRYNTAVTFLKTGFENQLITIVNYEYNTHDFILKSIDLCHRLFNKRFKSKLSVGLSSAGQTPVHLPRLYSEACEALLMSFWEPSKNIFNYDPDLHLSALPIKSSEEILDKIDLDIKLSNLKSAFFYVDSICTHQDVIGKTQPDHIKEYLWTFILTLAGKMNIQYSFINYVLSISGIHPYKMVKTTNTIDELNLCIKELVQHVHMHYLSKNSDSNMNVMAKAKKIVDENFHKDISLEQVAKHVFLSPAYFSELFKKETGMSFIEYKILLRIDTAKKLIQTTNLNPTEICNHIGYTDPKYFSKLFKRITGLSPNEYKEKNHYIGG